MNWYEHCENPTWVDAYFSTPPDLNPLVVTDFDLSDCSPSLRVTVELPSVPDKMHGRFDDLEHVTACLQLCFWNVAEVTLEKWPASKAGTLELQRVSDQRLDFTFTSNDGGFSGNCQWAMVESVDAYKADSIKSEPPAGRLVAANNTWNTCLILLHQMGFELKIAGPPNKQGGTSRCTWNALKDDTKLTAYNPIELLGLATIFNHHAPNTHDDYWWRVDGPAILDELVKNWSDAHFGPLS